MINENKDSESLKTYTPVIIFVAATFIFKLYGVTEATNLIISVFLSLITFMVKSAMLKEKYGDYPERKKITLQSGLLTVVFIIIFFNGFLHWYKIWHINLRWTIFFILLLIYFIILFRSVHVLKTIKVQLEKRNTKGKK